MKKAALIGGGVIGGGWAARFLLNGWQVNLYDPNPSCMQAVNAVLDNARHSLPLLSDNPLPDEGKIHLCATLDEAVQAADWIQDSTPERLELKRDVLRQIQETASTEAIIASSTSGFTPSALRAHSPRPEQIIVAHPYNPVYLLPVVELVGGKDNPIIGKAKTYLEQIGMKPIILAREIDAHIGDRLLEAVWREALWLIKDDIATTADIDDIITHGFGLRWAQMGLFETYRIAGGEAGMRHFISQFGPALAWPWTKLTDVPDLDDALIDKITHQSDAQSGHLSLRELEQIRDRNLVGILRVLKDHKWAAGQLLADKPASSQVSLTRMSSTQESPTQAALAQASSMRASLMQAPFQGYRATILPAWIDYNGHMTEYRYLQVMSDASDYLLLALGADEDYRQSGYSIYTVETHIRHLSEAKLGEIIIVDTQILEIDEKKVRLFHNLRNDSGQQFATGEQLWLHVDMKRAKAAPMRSPLSDNIQIMMAAHADLPIPEGAARFVGQKR